jgi:hypothetical protein
LENKSRGESKERTPPPPPPPQLQHRDGAYIMTGVEIDEYHMQMIAP